MDEMSRNRTGLIRSIIVLTICIISCTIFLANNKAQIKMQDKEEEETQILDPTTTNAIEDFTQDDSIDRTKITLESVNYMLRSTSDVYTDQENLKTMTINSVSLLGYLASNPTEKYGRIEGTYSCVDNTGDCFYTETKRALNDGTYSFVMPVVFTLNQSKNYYISLINDDSMTESSAYQKDYKEIK